MLTGAAALPSDGPIAAFGGGVGVAVGVGDGDGTGRPRPPTAARLPARRSAPASAAARYPRRTDGPRPVDAAVGRAAIGTTGSVGTASSGGSAPSGGSTGSAVSRTSAPGGRDSVMREEPRQGVREAYPNARPRTDREAGRGSRAHRTPPHATHGDGEH